LKLQFQQLVKGAVSIRRALKASFATNAAVAQDQNPVGIGSDVLSFSTLLH